MEGPRARLAPRRMAATQSSAASRADVDKTVAKKAAAWQCAAATPADGAQWRPEVFADKKKAPVRFASGAHYQVRFSLPAAAASIAATATTAITPASVAPTGVSKSISEANGRAPALANPIRRRSSPGRGWGDYRPFIALSKAIASASFVTGFLMTGISSKQSEISQ
jgi:hypothetical protein